MFLIYTLLKNKKIKTPWDFNNLLKLIHYYRIKNAHKIKEIEDLINKKQVKKKDYLKWLI